MKNPSKIKLTEKSTVFTTGVFLQPVECIIEGRSQWRWVAVDFENETYFEDEPIEVYDAADRFEGLLRGFED